MFLTTIIKLQKRRSKQLQEAYEKQIETINQHHEISLKRLNNEITKLYNEKHTLLSELDALKSSSSSNHHHQHHHSNSNSNNRFNARLDPFVNRLEQSSSPQQNAFKSSAAAFAESITNTSKFHFIKLSIDFSLLHTTILSFEDSTLVMEGLNSYNNSNEEINHLSYKNINNNNDLMFRRNLDWPDISAQNFVNLKPFFLFLIIFIVVN